MKTVQELYAAVHKVAVNHGATPHFLADIDAIFSPDAPVQAAPAAPVVGPVGADGKPTIVYTGPAGDAAAMQAFVQQCVQLTGGYEFTIVNSDGVPLDNQGNPIDGGTADTNAGHYGNNLDVTNPGIMGFVNGQPTTYTFRGDGSPKILALDGVSGSQFRNVLQSTLTCNGETVFDHREPQQAIDGYRSEQFELTGLCVWSVAVDATANFAGQLMNGNP
jgi:hypothetical protein